MKKKLTKKQKEKSDWMRGYEVGRAKLEAKAKVVDGLMEYLYDHFEPTRD